MKTPSDVAEVMKCLADMERASNNFYCLAVQAQNHAFIEFTGLMNEYINVCRDAAKNGIDFRTASTHTGRRLDFKDHHLKYIREKLECIYGIDVLSATPSENFHPAEEL